MNDYFKQIMWAWFGKPAYWKAEDRAREIIQFLEDDDTITFFTDDYENVEEGIAHILIYERNP